MGFGSLVVTFGLLHVACWAGPIDVSFMKVPPLQLAPRLAPSERSNASRFAIIAIVGVLLLGCLLILAVLLIRRHRCYDKTASDGELESAPDRVISHVDISSPPKVYNDRSRSTIRTLSNGEPGALFLRPIPPAQNNTRQMKHRVPVPYLPGLPKSPRLQQPHCTSIDPPEMRRCSAAPSASLDRLPDGDTVITADVTPLSANRLEQMIIQMEGELKEKL